MDINTFQKFKQSGSEYIRSGMRIEAIHDLEKCLEISPNDVDVLTMLADVHQAQKQTNAAADYYRKALTIDPINTQNLLKLSAIELSGPNYLKVLEANHLRLKPQRYVEIGVCKGASFGLASSQTTAIGIDPEPQLDIASLPEKHKVISETSDAYFSSDKAMDDLDGQPFDMAFLDGMHLFEYALRDFMNLEKYSDQKSVVFIHDLYPMNAETATRERNSDFWSGDVWKLILCLQEYRPDLSLSLLPCPPTGLGVITNLDSESTNLQDNYKQIVQKYTELPYSKIENNKDKKLQLAGLDSRWLN